MTDDKRDHSDAEEIAAQAAGLKVAMGFKRAFSAYRLYGKKHHHTQAAEEALVQDAIKIAADRDLTFFVATPTYLLVHGKKVLEEERREEAFVQPLFNDGVEAISLSQDLSPDELLSLVRTWDDALRGALGFEHSFVTRIFELDLSTISVRVRPDIAEGSSEDEAAKDRANRQAALVSSILAEHQFSPSETGRRVDPGALAVIANVKSLRELTSEELKKVAANDGGMRFQLSTNELTQVQKEAGDEEGAEMRALSAIWRTFVRAGPLERAELLEFSSRVIGELISQQRVTVLSQTIHQEREASKVTADALGELLAPLAEASVAKALVDRILSENDSESEELLKYLPEKASDGLIAALANSEGEERERVTGVILRRMPSAETLGRWASSLGGVLFKDLTLIAHSLGEEHEALVLAGLFAHKGTKAVATALRFITPENASKYRAALLGLLTASDLDSRTVAFALLLRAQDPEAADAMEVLASQPGTPSAAVASAIAGVARSFGAACERNVLRVLLTTDDLAVRLAAVRALGAIGSEVSTPSLKSISEKLVGERELRQTAAEAIKKIQARKDEVSP